MIKTTQGNISILDSNTGNPTIIFLHGHCTNKSFFANQMNLSEYRLISIDLPGYGKSDKPKDPEKVYNFPGFADVIAEVITTLNLKNFIIVGWSLGGCVALELTSRLPLLKGLLITGTPPIEISANGLAKGFKISNPKLRECFGKGNLTEEEAQLLATISGYDYTPEKRFLVDAILETDEGAKTIYPQSIMKGIGQDQTKIVREWAKPICVIAGEDDIGINNDYIINEVTFGNLWRNKVHVIPHAGHAVQLDQPEKFNEILKDFCLEIM